MASLADLVEELNELASNAYTSGHRAAADAIYAAAYAIRELDGYEPKGTY